MPIQSAAISWRGSAHGAAGRAQAARSCEGGRWRVEGLEERRLLANTIIDLMVVYTPAARDSAGSTASMLSIINDAVADTNTAFVNSQIDLRVNLVHTALVSYIEDYNGLSGDIGQDLDRLRDTNDGFMDEVHALRNQKGADLVSLFTDISLPRGGTAGLGYLLSSIDPGNTTNDDFGFTVVATDFAAGPSYTLAHEIGHNLGGSHDPGNSSGQPLFPYAYGYRFTGNDGRLYHDIMAYDPGETIPYFSNPAVLYAGVPTGTPTANLALTFSQTGPIVADYRPTVIQDRTAPTAALIPATLSASMATFDFNVTYSDNAQIDVSTIDGGDLLVEGPGGFTQMPTRVSVTPSGNGTPRQATYRLTRPGEDWKLIHNGNYTVKMRPAQVSDLTGNFVAAATLGILKVEIADLEGPTATATANDLTEPAESLTFTVTYSDETGIDVSTLGDNEISVSGPRGFLRAAVFLSVNLSSNGTPRTATYRLDGRFTANDNGTYRISLNNGGVSDTRGHGSPSKDLSTFEIRLPDNFAPTAVLQETTVVSTAGGGNKTLKVDYLDVGEIDVATLGTGEIRVTGPGGFEAFPTYFGATPGGNGLLRTGTYRLIAPGGAWNVQDNGLYTIELVGGKVKDVAGNTAAGGVLGTFVVDIPDTTAPTAVVTVAPIRGGVASTTVMITYSDDIAMDLASLDSGDLLVASDLGYEGVATFVRADVEANALTIVATYTFGAPGGFWDIGDAANYTITLLDGQVLDVASNAMSGADLATVLLEIVDAQAPLGTVTVGDVTSAGTTHTLSVTYSDDQAIDPTTISNADVRITGPGGFALNAMLVGRATGSLGSWTAQYQFTAPGGTWDPDDNGVYTVLLNSNQIVDTGGNSAAATTLGAFTVNLPKPAPVDTAAPTVKVTNTSFAKVAAAGGRSYTFRLTYLDNLLLNASTIGDGDVEVVTAGFRAIAKLVSKTPAANAKTIVATYRITPPGGTWDRLDNRVYTVRLLSNQVKDSGGRAAGARTLGTFAVNVPVVRPARRVRPIDATPARVATEAASLSSTGTFNFAEVIDEEILT